jgi:hypothetical protein
MGKIAWTGVAAVGFMALMALVATDAGAADPLLGIGEVNAGAAGAFEDVDDGTLRGIVEEAIGTLDPGKLPRGRAALISVSVVRLESKPPATSATGGAAGSTSSYEASCVVSATLRDRARGAVFAVLEGSARGQDEPRRRRVLARAILRAAVTSAVARVPEALRVRR